MTEEELTDEEVSESIRNMNKLKNELTEHIELSKLYRNDKISFDALQEALEDTEILKEI